MLENDPEMRRRYDELTGVKKPDNRPRPQNSGNNNNNK